MSRQSVLVALLLIGGCDAFKSTDQIFEGCVPTDMYIYERNPVGKRQVYDCSAVNRR